MTTLAPNKINAPAMKCRADNSPPNTATKNNAANNGVLNLTTAAVVAPHNRQALP